MSELAKILGLLKSDAIEKQIAAAIVLAELHPKGAEVAAALAATLDSDVAILQRHALTGLARIGAKKALPKIFPLLAASDGDVRRAASAAIASVGEEVVPIIKERMASATPDERHALELVLAELGGRDAFTALLATLVSADEEQAKAAAIAVRQRAKSADAKQRRTYLSETEKFLEKAKKAKPKPGEPSNAGAIGAVLKIMGFLEDEKALPTLLAYAADTKQPASVRQEAIIAVRFCMKGGKVPAKLVEALLDCAALDDRTLAQTALHTLGSLELPAGVQKRLEKLVTHPDMDRARFVIEQLGRQADADAAKVLVGVLTGGDRKRVEIAGTALTGMEAAVPLLAKALLEETDADRAWMLRNVLRPAAKKIAPAMRRALLDAALKRFGSGARGWEALLDVVRDADPAGTADALRDLGHKLKKTNPEKAVTVMRLLCRTDKASDDDRYQLATIELARKAKDTRPAARAGDEALKQLSALLARGFDLAGALRKDRSVELEDLFYLGFHFAEEGHPVGEELLGEVVRKGGRAKIAKMAKNKLALVAD